MSVLPPTLFEALDADPSLWPGPLAPEGRRALADQLGGWPDEVRGAVVSALVDPERNAWAHAAILGGRCVAAAGGAIVGMVTDDVLEATDARGDRFGLQPLGFRLPASPSGDPADVDRLLRALDAAFGSRGWVLWLRRPVPSGLAVEPIRKAVQIWLSALDRGERVESHAVYEDDVEGVALDLTVLDVAQGSKLSGRVLTVPPLAALERLASVDAHIVEAATRSEETVGDLALLVALAADSPWLVSRGYVQQLLFGTPDSVLSTRDGERTTYEASFTANGRSLYSDPACRRVAATWWIEPGPPGAPAFTSSVKVLENPWADHAPALTPPWPRFVPLEAGHRARMRWDGR